MLNCDSKLVSWENGKLLKYCGNVSFSDQETQLYSEGFQVGSLCEITISSPNNSAWWFCHQLEKSHEFVMGRIIHDYPI